MKNKSCTQCKKTIDILNEQCSNCGFSIVLEPDEEKKARYLRRPSIGALFWTQGWALGARLYLWLVLSLMPVVGLVALVACVLFGRRWSWKYGGWRDWETFTERMRLLDILSAIWITGLVAAYFWLRQSGLG